MSGAHATLCSALAEDLLQLSALHERELDLERIAALRQTRFPESLGLLLNDDAGTDARQLLSTALAALGEQPEEAQLDDLAADYADLYLNHGLQTSPYESVWLDEDGLARQTPMFQIREYYQRHGLGAREWRNVTEDHLSLQLAFLAYLFGSAAEDQSPTADLQEAARFMDEHLLRWLPEFGRRTAHRCATPFYAGLGLLTASYAEELRQLLELLLEQPRATSEEVEERLAPAPEAVAVPLPSSYVPGTAPSW